MMDMSKVFLVIGSICIAIGLLWRFFGKIPGDILIKKGNVTFFFPIVTSLLLSVILSVIFYVIQRFK